MRTFFKNYGLLIWLTLILISGFVLTAGITYIASRDAIHQEIIEQTLPNIGDNLVSEIQKALLRTTLIASQIAEDEALKDLLKGPDDPVRIKEYIRQAAEKLQLEHLFVVSEASRQYYSEQGVHRSLQELAPKDEWYLRLRDGASTYETRVETDPLGADALQIVIYSRVVDADGAFVGVVGTAFAFDNIKALIGHYQKRFKGVIYFVDSKGNLVITANASAPATGLASGPTVGNIVSRRGIAAIAGEIIAHKKVEAQRLEYQTETENVLLNSRFIPELNWYLIVEQSDSTSIKSVRQTFWLILLIDAVITILVMVILLVVVHRNQRKLEKAAATDPLTLLLNRQAFEFVFQQALLDSQRTRQPMCVALVDIDFFKQVNDKNGHLVGDHVLKEIALIAKRSLRESDVICRWGGEEFLILLKNCTLEKSTSIAENLRATIEANDFSRTTDLAKKRLAVTVSMGVAACKDDDTDDTVFERADVALYQAKANGRNSVYFSE